MEILAALLKGVALGLSIAAPVGPIGLLCIRRTLADGRAAGLASGLGAATADALYGLVAASGFTALAALLDQYAGEVRLIGGFLLLCLGVATFRARPAAEAAKPGAGGLVGGYVSTFVLTLANPATILSFAAAFAGFGLAVGEAGPRFALVAGVFAGSALWWLLLSGGVALARRRVTPGAMAWINRVSGLVLIGFGTAALLVV